jgi:glycyl-tRNA synthetase beta chain
MSEPHQDLLIEIGCEELPPTALLSLADAFAREIGRGLDGDEIAHGELEVYATPRRLAVVCRAVAPGQPDQVRTRRGPAVSAAWDAQGEPTPAALGFARSCGVGIDSLQREATDKGEWLVHRTTSAGLATPALIPAITEHALAALPIPKRMRWGGGDAEFVRPVHWVCLLFGPQLIECRILGAASMAATCGHRFHHPEEIPLGTPGEYAAALRQIGRIEPDFARRREMVRAQVTEVAKAEGLSADIDDALLDEVTALVEWPRALLARFDPEFLEVPSEVLIETMRSHQKYFPVRDATGALAPRFVAVANIESRDPSQVTAGNERVIRPRFADAKFFWEQDLKTPLESNLERLDDVVFQDKLGSVGDKARRIARLARSMAQATGEDADAAARAGLLAKCDLISTMVFEFPSLQGVMGRYYALRSGETPEVADGIREHYLPRFAGDGLPGGPCGRVVGLADRLDTLVGVFGVGMRPSGTKDPYGLRRSSIALLRILIETPVDLDLAALLAETAEGYPPGVIATGTAAEALAYILERLSGYYQDQGIAGDVVESVLATGATNPHLIDLRVRAVAGFRGSDAAASLSAANKRIRNILQKSDSGEASRSADPDPALFEDTAERALWERMAVVEQQVGPLLEVRDFASTLTVLAALRTDVDNFFDRVLVMAEDPRVRANRHALLAKLIALFQDVADISKLQPEVS